MNFYLSAILLGLAYCGMGLGIYITLRIFNIPDITTDGSYTLGAAVTAAMLSHQDSLPLTLVAVILSGALAGTATGLIHTRMKVDPLLSGILVMTALYSVNLWIMGSSNIPLIHTGNIENLFHFLPGDTARWIGVLVLFCTVLCWLVSWLLGTDFGLAMRATGNSESMVRALGVNTKTMKVIGLAIANALTALSGFLVCQYQQFTDINMGIGIVIFGLGAVIMGEAILGFTKIQSIPLHLLGVILGCVLFRLIIGMALLVGINPNWLRMVTAVIVLLVVGWPSLRKKLI
ncbi:MAG: ABC transporter permease [Chitinophagaceae bacterium]